MSNMANLHAECKASSVASARDPHHDALIALLQANAERDRRASIEPTATQSDAANFDPDLWNEVLADLGASKEEAPDVEREEADEPVPQPKRRSYSHARPHRKPTWGEIGVFFDPSAIRYQRQTRKYAYRPPFCVDGPHLLFEGETDRYAAWRDGFRLYVYDFETATWHTARLYAKAITRGKHGHKRSWGRVGDCRWLASLFDLNKIPGMTDWMTSHGLLDGIDNKTSGKVLLYRLVKVLAGVHLSYVKGRSPESNDVVHHRFHKPDDDRETETEKMKEDDHEREHRYDRANKEGWGSWKDGIKFTDAMVDERGAAANVKHAQISGQFLKEPAIEELDQMNYGFYWVQYADNTWGWLHPEWTETKDRLAREFSTNPDNPDLLVNQKKVKVVWTTNGFFHPRAVEAIPFELWMPVGTDSSEPTEATERASGSLQPLLGVNTRSEKVSARSRWSAIPSRRARISRPRRGNPGRSLTSRGLSPGRSPPRRSQGPPDESIAPRFRATKRLPALRVRVHVDRVQR